MVNFQVLVPTDALSVAGIHADFRDWAEHCPRHAKGRVQIQRPTVDVCLPAATGGEEGQEQGEGGDGSVEYNGEAEEERSGEEERRENGSGE